MATKLTDIDIEEVSFVVEPANRGARVLLFKEDKMEKTKDEIFEAIKKTAEQDRRDGETFAACLDRVVCERPELYAAYRGAPAAEPVSKQASETDPLEQLETKALAEIHEIAGLILRSHPEMSDEQAILRAVEEHPLLMQRYYECRHRLLTEQ